MFWVYMLRCVDGSYYTGHTDDLECRLDQHASGACGGYTAQRLPVVCVWSQVCFTREEALDAELKIKRWNRRKKEALIRGDWEQVSLFARKRFE